MAKIRVNVGRPYDVVIQSGLLAKAGEYIREVVTSDTLAIVTDDTVDSLYGEAFTQSLEATGFSVCKFVFPHGEESKNGRTYLEILNFLAESRLTRADAVVALGGGVVGDITGFAAATYLRGIKYIQVPTTLLSAVDSSVGGKCAIDLETGKNLAGAFYQPSLVLCDHNTFDTLPKKIFLDGCGEVLKYGILYSKELLDHLIDKGLGFDREYVVTRCVAMKAAVVERDEFDRGERALLNLGHTTAHAIEKLSGFAVSHGAAVATGCAVAARASYARGLTSAETVDLVCRSVQRLGHKTSADYSVDDICDVMLSDKKRHGNTVDFITVRDIGECEIYEISIDELKEFVRTGISEAQK